MTQAQEAYLSVVKDGEVKTLLDSYGFEVAGPTSKGVYMFCEDNGKAWLLTEMRGLVAPVRHILPSFWCDANVEAMNRR